jgi:hypothetical protein
MIHYTFFSRKAPNKVIRISLSRIASGVGKPLYADKMTEDQQRLGYAQVLVEIDTKSMCPKEVTIRRKDGRTVSIEVVYPWLPPKCSSCGGFGHIAYACAKKEVKVWVPKQKGTKVSSPKQKVTKLVAGSKGPSVVKSPKVLSGGSKSFGKAVSKPIGVRLSNTYAPLRVNADGDFQDVAPPTFLDFLENALSSQERGKGKIGDYERGFSPTL